jgi:hypothetical protein
MLAFPLLRALLRPAVSTTLDRLSGTSPDVGDDFNEAQALAEGGAFSTAAIATTAPAGSSCNASTARPAAPRVSRETTPPGSTSSSAPAQVQSRTSKRCRWSIRSNGSPSRRHAAGARGCSHPASPPPIISGDTNDGLFHAVCPRRKLRRLGVAAYRAARSGRVRGRRLQRQRSRPSAGARS